MSRIRIINRYKDLPQSGEVVVDIMRGAPLGNPFVMRNRSDKERDRVCDLYHSWLLEKYKDVHNPQFIELLRLALLVKEGNRIALECCCAPKRCHGESVKIAVRDTLAHIYGVYGLV